MLRLRGHFAGVVQILRCAQDDKRTGAGPNVIGVPNVILSEAKDLNHKGSDAAMPDLARAAA
jgi:hypothetical protein